VGTVKSGWDFHSMRERLKQERAGIAGQCRELLYIDAIRKAIPGRGSLVIDNTILGYWSEYFYPSLTPGGLVTGKGSSIIGFAFPAAIGLKIACPDMPVVALSGDGGFFYGAQELATCRRHGIGFPVVVVNDSSFGMIELLQHQAYRRGAFETDFFNPDLRMLAASFGITSERVDSPQALEKALSTALESREMHIIELVQTFRESPFARF
jgi:acetolactate synthase-1/2/3 large subunit